MEWLLGIITACLGCTTLVSFILYRSAEKRVKNAEANKAETAADVDKFEMYEKRLQHCNEIIELHNTTIQNQGVSLQKFDDVVREKTLRIRQISDELYKSESELNRVNSELVRLTSELGRLRLLYEMYRLWHCRIADCPHRIPPRPELKGQIFEEHGVSWETGDEIVVEEPAANETAEVVEATGASVENETASVENETAEVEEIVDDNVDNEKSEE